MDEKPKQPEMDREESKKPFSNSDQPELHDSKTTINTGGGAFISGSATVQGGDFVGRDKITITEETAYDVRGLRNPYLGLRAFTYTDQTAFGGREWTVREAVNLLTQPGAERTVLFITGASGSGKSSFTQAGLLPALEAHYQTRRKEVSRAIFRPSANPLAMLADAFGLLALPQPTLEEMRGFTAEEIGHFLAKHTPKDLVNVLIIDQFEEVFTQSVPEQRAVLFDFLAAFLPFAEICTHVVISMRSDFLQELFNHKALWDIAKQGIELRAMSQDELKQAIQQPLWAAYSAEPDKHKRFESALLDRLAEDASADAAYLPLLQVTLQELWNGGSLTLGRYNNLTDAIRRRAEIVFQYEDFESSQPQKVRTPEDQEAILDIFLDLVDVSLDDDSRRDVRRPRQKGELAGNNPSKLRLVDELIRARMLSANQIDNSDKAEKIDIIHESLINNWDRLKATIADRRRTLRQRARFEQQLAEWLGSDRPDHFALTGVRLAEARELERVDDVALRRAEAKEFLQRSNDLVNAAQRRRLRNSIYVAVALAVALLIVVIAAVIAMVQSKQLAKEAKINLSRGLSAQSQEVLLTQPSLLQRATLLSIEALHYSLEREGIQTLADTLRFLPKHVSQAEIINSAVYAVAFSPDGKKVVSGYADGTVMVWEAATGLEVSRTKNHNTFYYSDFFSKYISSVAFSPDGEWVVSGSEDGTLTVWDAATGHYVAWMTHGIDEFGITKILDCAVSSVAFSPDGKWLVSGSEDGTARVWEAATGQEVARMTHGIDDFGQSSITSSIVSSVAFSQDGKWVVSGSEDGTARVWEAATGREVARMSNGGNDFGQRQSSITNSIVSSVAFSPNGEWVVSGSWDGAVRVWEAATGHDVARMAHVDKVNSVAFSPDGKWVLSGSQDGTARVWEATTGNEVARITHKDDVNSVAFSPDGKWVMSGGEDGTARVWEAATGREMSRMAHEDDVNSVAFSPDGKWVVSGSEDGTARVWEADQGSEMAYMAHGGDVNSVAFSPDGKWVVSGSEDGTARVWEAATGRELALMPHEDIVSSVAFSPDGKWVVSGSIDDRVIVWEAVTGQAVARMTHSEKDDLNDSPFLGIFSVAFSPDGKWVVSGSEDGTARVWEAATGQEVARMTHRRNDFGQSSITNSIVSSVAFSPDGKWVVSGSEDGTARVWEAATGREVARMSHSGIVTSVAFSPNGKWVVSGRQDSTARVWEATTGREVARMALEGDVNSVAFSPDGKWVVSGSEDRAARVWEAATGREVAYMPHEGDVNSVAFSPDGKWVVSGSEDGTARVWEAATGRQFARMAHDGIVNSVAFSPDSNLVMSGSEDGIVIVWLWNPQDLIALACSRLDRNLTQAEWKQYLGEQPYRQTCPNLPPGE